jgi:hypothetical protein
VYLNSDRELLAESHSFGPVCNVIPDPEQFVTSSKKQIKNQRTKGVVDLGGGERASGLPPKDPGPSFPPVLSTNAISEIAPLAPILAGSDSTTAPAAAAARASSQHMYTHIGPKQTNPTAFPAEMTST